MPAPDVDTLLCIAWGWPDESVGLFPAFAAAANVVVGSNPPYSVADFMAMYPKFFGVPTPATITLTANSPQGNLASTVPSAAAGQLITGPGIAPGTTVQSISGTAVVLSTPATSAQSGSQAQIFTAPMIPLAVLNVFITLASASLAQGRYLDSWTFVMALYIAHFVTLWLQSEGQPATTAGQAASAGLVRGIAAAKSVGDVSVSYESLTSNAQEWGSFQATTYGAQLITLARIAGSGPMVIW